VRERFWQYVVVPDDDSCWEWVGRVNCDSYGSINGGKEFNNKKLQATHVSYLIQHGSLPPKGKYLCHTCDNPGCVNPNHIFVGTQTDNMHDAINKGRIKGTALSDDDVAFIRYAYKNKILNQKELALKFNCSASHISKIISNNKRKIQCQI
jgi:hypothetical protein